MEEAGAERDDAESLDALWILAEEVEIEAEVEDAEVLLAVVRTEQIRTESRAASDHLPELDLRVDRLEENQVRNLGNVDAGVEHIHRDGDVRRGVLLCEVVEEALRIRRIVVDDAREGSLMLRVVVIESLLDELRVRVVASKEDRFGQPVSPFDCVAMLHQGAGALCPPCLC